MVIDKDQLKKQREGDMFAARPWLDNAIPHTPRIERVSISGAILVSVFAVITFLLMLLTAAPTVQ